MQMNPAAKALSAFTRLPLLAFALLTATLFWVGGLTPPMQAPDEGTHLLRAYAVSKGRWLPSTPPGHMTGDMVDSQFLEYGLAGTYEWLEEPGRLTEQRLGHLAAMRWHPDGSEVFFESPGAAYYAPLVYIPHAVGLAAGRWLDLTIQSSVEWARLLANATTAALLVAAFVFWRPPLVVVGMLLLPMTLSQAGAPTIDGITTGALLLGLSLFARFYAEQRRMPPAHAAMFFVCLTVCMTSRVHTLVLMALPFLLYLRTRQRAMAAMGAAAALIALAWTAFAAWATVDLRKPRAISTLDALQGLLAAPADFVHLLFNTLASPERQQQYAQSFIGVVGWANSLPSHYYPVFWWGLAALMLLSLRKWTPEFPLVRIALIAMALASAVFIFLALALTFTDPGADTIDGVQGRYFLPSAIMLATGIFWRHVPLTGSRTSDMPRPTSWLPIASAAVFAMASLSVLVGVLENRFEPIAAAQPSDHLATQGEQRRPWQ